MPKLLVGPHGLGEAIGNIRALTGTTEDMPLPSFPRDAVLGTFEQAETSYVSLQAAAGLGFPFGHLSASVYTQVLLMNYMSKHELLTRSTGPVISVTFGSGFRVAFAVEGLETSTSFDFGTLAVQSQVSGKRVQVSVQAVGMPQGPSIPGSFTTAVNFDIKTYHDLLSYIEKASEHLKQQRRELAPTIVEMTYQGLDGETMLAARPGVRFAMWRIRSGTTLLNALEQATDHPEIDLATIKAVYATVFRRPEMLLTTSEYHDDLPMQEQIGQANRWLFEYR